MAIESPSIVAWSSKDELEKLKSWFYDPQPSSTPGEPSIDLRQRAVHRVPTDLMLWLISGSSIPNSVCQHSLRNSLNSASNTGSAYCPFISITRVSHKYD